jgi:hypothetical protein
VFQSCYSGRAVSTGRGLRIVDTLDFHFVGKSDCSAPLLREIRDFLDSQDTSHPFQLPQWSGSAAQLALLWRRGRLQWLAQCDVIYPVGRFMRRIRALTVNRGPICDDLELMETGLRKLVDESRKMRIAHIDIAPEWAGTFAASARTVLARNGWQALSGVRSSLRLDLRPALDHLLASFRKTTRYEIRRSQVAGVRVTIANDETEFREFVRIYIKMASQKQFRAEDSGFLLQVFRWLAADRDRGGLFLAREGGTLRGGIVVVRSGARCWYVWGATSKDGQFSAGHLLQWRAIRWAKEKSCLEYDLGGFRDDMTSGPAFFKRGFCDRITHFLPPHRYVVDPGSHRLSELVFNVRQSLRRLLRS